jgi:hypothetical protein
MYRREEEGCGFEAINRPEDRPFHICIKRLNICDPRAVIIQLRLQQDGSLWAGQSQPHLYPLPRFAP